jgi:integrase
MAKLLTSLAVAHAKPYRRDGIAVLSEIRDGGCRGLRLVVHPTGHRTWIVRYRFHGRTRKLTLGAAVVARPGEPDPPNALTLANARKRASEALHKLAMGIDPAVEKLAERRPVAESAFATIATECFECSAKRGLRSAQRQLKDLQRRAFPMIGNIPIDAIRRSDIAKLLDQVEDTMGPTAADLTLEQISTVMNWWAARSDDYRPVLVRGMKRTNAKERARTRILSDPELVEVWSAAKTAGVFGVYLQFLLLVGCRRNEARFMRWSELSEDGVWELAAERNKSKQPVLRPLSQAALALLNQLPKSAELVFVGLYDLAGNKRAFDRRSGVSGWRLHDARRTSRSLMSRAGVPSEIGERCLGHLVAGVEAIYNRYHFRDEMRLAFEKLAHLIDTIVNPQPNVVALHG